MPGARPRYARGASTLWTRARRGCPVVARACPASRCGSSETSRRAHGAAPSVFGMQTRQQLCGVVDRIGMAMHDLPFTVLAPEDRRAAKHVRRRFGATYRRGRPFDREQICEVLAYVGGNHLPRARTAVRE